MKKSIVTYFSASGHTAKVAKRLIQALKADDFEIKPQKPYTREDLNWTDKESRSSVEMRDRTCRPPMASPVPDITKYQVVFIGFPIWWYREPSIIDTFIEACHFDGQVVVPFATSGGSELGETCHNLQALAPKAVVQKGKRFETNVSSTEIAAWAQSFL